MEYILRDYQQKAVDDALKSFKAKKNGILVLPTGSGKSLIIASIVKELGGKVIVLQPTKEILEQNKDKMQAFGCHNIGVYSASIGRKDIGKVTFATIGSVVNKKHLFENFDHMIIDECHKVNSKGGMYEKFINELDLPVIGLTATPYRMRSYNHFQTQYPVAESRILTRTRPRIFSKIVHITQVSKLFEDGYLCPLEYDYENNYDSKKITLTSTGQGFLDSALMKYNIEENIPQKMINILAKTESKHCLAFTQFTAESKVVQAGLRDRGVVCEEVNAKTKKARREQILWSFKKGLIKCVVNVGVLTTGFDFPELDCVVLGRPTNSVALYYQMTGRGVRIADQKQACKLIDLCDNVKRYGKIETFEIYDQNGNGMWRLRSDVGNLTGINARTGENLETVKETTKSKPGEPVMVTFGKHKGEVISDLPTKYLEWCIDTFDSGKWKTIFKREIKTRA